MWKCWVWCCMLVILALLRWREKDAGVGWLACLANLVSSRPRRDPASKIKVNDTSRIVVVSVHLHTRTQKHVCTYIWVPCIACALSHTPYRQEIFCETNNVATSSNHETIPVLVLNGLGGFLFALCSWQASLKVGKLICLTTQASHQYF